MAKDDWNWLVADKKGLAQLIEKRGKAFALGELIQNAWDENGVTEVNVWLTRIEGKALVRIEIEDDAPKGWLNIDDAYTLYAPSKKKKDPGKRGRFNRGVALVLSISVEAEIISMETALVFDRKGRRRSKKRRPKGTYFSALVRMTRAEADEVDLFASTLLPPEGLVTNYNGESIEQRDPVHAFDATLPTVNEDEDGNLSPSKRKTAVEIYHPEEEEEGTLYEMGIPVVETGDKYHVNVMQKVPLNMDRDNVTPSFLRKVRTLTLNEMSDHLESQDVNDAWVQEAVKNPDAAPEALKEYKEKKYGKKATTYDPSDPEANKAVVADGYTVIHGNSESKEVWENFKDKIPDLVPPSGRVRPTKTPKFSPEGKDITVPPEKWTAGQRKVVAFTKELATRLLNGIPVSVGIVSDTQYYGAMFGGCTLSYNQRRLGKKWFAEGPNPAVVETIIHELGHYYASDHLSEEYYRALCKLGARLGKLVLDDPDFFEGVW